MHFLYNIVIVVSLIYASSLPARIIHLQQRQTKQAERDDGHSTATTATMGGICEKLSVVLRGQGHKLSFLSFLLSPRHIHGGNLSHQCHRQCIDSWRCIIVSFMARKVSSLSAGKLHQPRSKAGVDNIAMNLFVSSLGLT